VFAGPTAEKYKQIGNAVPVGLGRVIGFALMSFFEGSAEGADVQRRDRAVAAGAV